MMYLIIDFQKGLTNQLHYHFFGMHTHCMRGTCTLLEGYRDLPKMKGQKFGIP